MQEPINKVFFGNCLDVLPTLATNSVDSIVTDAPYELGFMGKSWDNTGIANNVEMWKECLRVLKPGGHLLAFAGTRTYHRMASAIEDAGFEVRDMIEWVYGSGFPKSRNIGLDVDKRSGITKNRGKAFVVAGQSGQRDKDTGGDLVPGSNTMGAYVAQNEWSGWGTALKPAHEPICMARKPIAEKTVAENVLKYGTGGINIDESRVDGKTEIHSNGKRSMYGGNSLFESNTHNDKTEVKDYGRFPANLIHDNSEEVRECFPDAGKGNGRGAYNYAGREYDNKDTSMFNGDKPQAPSNFNDSGNASRFFKSIIYKSKASKSERNKGLDVVENKNQRPQGEAFGDGSAITEHSERKGNFHPTVKPIALMEYLINMVTPKGGIVLDPFAGSGSTLVAAKKNGYKYIGIEMTEEYIPIINARLK